ncbi:hypothetical protein NGH39_13210, partial [Staphylococcus pasteuri]
SSNTHLLDYHNRSYVFFLSFFFFFPAKGRKRDSSGSRGLGNWYKRQLRSPSEKWGVFSRLTYLGAKKAKDAQYTVYENKGRGTPLQKKVKDNRWLNKPAYVVSNNHLTWPTKRKG